MVFHRVSMEWCRTTMDRWKNRSVSDTKAFVTDLCSEADFITNYRIQYLQFPLPLLINGKAKYIFWTSILHSHTFYSVQISVLKAAKSKSISGNVDRLKAASRPYFLAKCCVMLLYNGEGRSCETPPPTHQKNNTKKNKRLESIFFLRNVSQMWPTVVSLAYCSDRNLFPFFTCLCSAGSLFSYYQGSCATW